MAYTPSATLAELDAQIAAYQAALTGLATAQSYSFDAGGARQQLNRADLPEVRKTLDWLEEKRARLLVGAGPQALAGRVRRW